MNWFCPYPHDYYTGTTTEREEYGYSDHINNDEIFNHNAIICKIECIFHCERYQIYSPFKDKYNPHQQSCDYDTKCWQFQNMSKAKN